MALRRSGSRIGSRILGARRRTVGIALTLAAIVGVVALLLVVTRSDDNDEFVWPDPGVAHVHGLGVNPADGVLYVATHHGLYRLASADTAERMNDSFQDTMGFTVAGPDHFLGSGHPDLRDDTLQVDGKPPLLGLIESTDAGRTWTPRSLLGDVDFHALVYRHGLIYGWSSISGELLVSSDGLTWERRSTLADLTALVVDPQAGDHLFAATPVAVRESLDGGRTWQPAGAPALAVLAWNDAGLWGIATTGDVYRREGNQWSAVSQLPGVPEALTADGDRLYAAMAVDDRTTISFSPDGGRSWDRRFTDSAESFVTFTR
jgi:hypothetical protein